MIYLQNRKISLLSYHKFEYDKDIYILNIEKMIGGKISRETSSALDKYSSDKDFIFSPEVFKELKKFKLFFPETPEHDGTDTLSSQENHHPLVTQINLFITRHCNLRCTYCYVEKETQGKNGYMDKETAFRAVDWFIEQSKNAENLIITFFGGEALLNFPLIQQIVDYSREREKKNNKVFNFFVATNGTLLDNGKISYFKKNNITPLVSLDGPEEIHDRNRPFHDGKGSYKIILPKLLELLNIFPQTECKATIYGDTDPRLIAEELEKVGFSCYFLAIATMSDKKPGKNKSLFLLDLMKEFVEAEANKFLKAIKNRDRSKITYNPYMDFSALIKGKRHYYCGMGRQRIGISVSGDIYPCHRFVGLKEFKIGNIYESELKRDIYLQGPFINSVKCSKCLAKYYCGGGCRHDHLMVTGSIFEPNDKFCQLKKFEIEMAIYIFSQLNTDDLIWMGENKIIPSRPCYMDF